MVAADGGCLLRNREGGTLPPATSASGPGRHLNGGGSVASCAAKGAVLLKPPFHQLHGGAYGALTL
jgi:hypothetical protein